MKIEKISWDVGWDMVGMGVGLGCEGKGKADAKNMLFSWPRALYAHYFKDIRQGVCIRCVGRATRYNTSLLAMQSAVLATAIPSVCLSVTHLYPIQTNEGRITRS